MCTGVSSGSTESWPRLLLPTLLAPVPQAEQAFGTARDLWRVEEEGEGGVVSLLLLGAGIVAYSVPVATEDGALLNYCWVFSQVFL